MKSLINAVVVAAVLAAPVISFAQQSSAPVTRAEVRNELAQLGNAGYTGAPIGPYYPANLQAAEAHIAGQSSSEQVTNSGYGPPAVGSSRSGHPGVSVDTQ